MPPKPPLTLVALKKTVTSGNRTYPIFIGFLSAAEIIEVAAAPAFTEKSQHHDIATNVLSPPIRHWQRPLDEHRTAAISDLFSNAGEFMPNPVLLSENIFDGSAITVNQVIEAGMPAGTYEIVIKRTSPNAEKPLWILDGQHRINGLANSAQKYDSIPLVILLNQGGNYYDGPTLAKIFAQVTTEATKLHALHDEWLTFAFRLKKYNSSIASDAGEHAEAMTAVANLCSKTQFISRTGGSKPNPFHNRVQFNDHANPPVAPPPGGFRFTCAALEAYFYKYYFSQPLVAGVGRLNPGDYVDQFLLAHDALRSVVSSPQNQSVFFGDVSHEQVIMQEAFIAGVSARLLHSGAPKCWHDLLLDLKFDQTPWNFKSWIVSLHGKVQRESKNVARRVFCEAFTTGKLPTGTSNLADYLKGDRGQITIRSHKRTRSGRPSKKGIVDTLVDGGSVKSMTEATNRIIKISSHSSNIANLEITDRDSPPGQLVTYTKDMNKKGLVIDGARKFRLLVTFHYYGGLQRTGDVDVIP